MHMCIVPTQDAHICVLSCGTGPRSQQNSLRPNGSTYSNRYAEIPTHNTASARVVLVCCRCPGTSVGAFFVALLSQDPLDATAEGEREHSRSYADLSVFGKSLGMGGLVPFGCPLKQPKQEYRLKKRRHIPHGCICISNIRRTYFDTLLMQC